MAPARRPCSWASSCSYSASRPSVGLLALQTAAYKEVEPYPLDVLGAESEGMIGYLVEQELGNLLPYEQPIATILTQIQVDPLDPAFKHPSKPIGPIYTKSSAFMVLPSVCCVPGAKRAHRRPYAPGDCQTGWSG
jgi:carbamate kinase